MEFFTGLVVTLRAILRKVMELPNIQLKDFLR